MSGAAAGRRPEPAVPHPTRALDDVVHHRTRLGILAVLREVDQAEFGYLRDALGLSDGNLSRHLRTLEAAGHLHIRKGYQDKRPRTWLRLTAKGTRALDQELATLRSLVNRLDRTQAAAAGPARRTQSPGLTEPGP
jgi:DNA-binding MarR family transcriptional regulator